MRSPPLHQSWGRKGDGRTDRDRPADDGGGTDGRGTAARAGTTGNMTQRTLSGDGMDLDRGTGPEEDDDGRTGVRILQHLSRHGRTKRIFSAFVLRIYIAKKPRKIAYINC